MSVDDRLREAFGETDRSWDQHVPEALSAVTQRHRRVGAVRRGAAAALAAAAAVAAIAVTVSQRADEEPVPSPDPTPPTRTGLAAKPNPLDGTWVSEPLTGVDVRRAARLAGDAADAEAMLADLPPRPFQVVLYVNGRRSSLHAVLRAKGQAEQTADEENITVRGVRVVMQPMFDEGENVHSYVLEDNELRLRFVSTTEPESGGVAGEAWQRLLYDTATFTSGR